MSLSAPAEGGLPAEAEDTSADIFRRKSRADDDDVDDDNDDDDDDDEDELEDEGAEEDVKGADNVRCSFIHDGLPEGRGFFYSFPFIWSFFFHRLFFPSFLFVAFSFIFFLVIS